VGGPPAGDADQPTEPSEPPAGRPHQVPPADATPDWFSPVDQGTEVARADVPLALLLMLGEHSWQRIDGMGMARRALEVPPTGDRRRDLTDEERLQLANARAWCLAVHGDLAPRGRRDDPIQTADADRYATLAGSLGPGDPRVATTVALVRLRQGRVDEALERAAEALGVLAERADAERTGRMHGPAVLAAMTWALALAAAGQLREAWLVARTARAARVALDVDEVAFASLLAELPEPPA
jgi:hypothetical protein